MFGYNRQSCQLWCNLWLCDKKKTWAVRKKSRVQSSGSTLDFQGYRHWSRSFEPIDKVSWHQWWTRGSTMSVSAVNVRPLQAGPSFSATRPSEQKQKQKPGQPAQTGTAPIPLFLRIPSTYHHNLSIREIFSFPRLHLSFVSSMLRKDPVNRFFSRLLSHLQLHSPRHLVSNCPLTVPRHSSPRARSHNLTTLRSYRLRSTVHTTTTFSFGRPINT